MPDFLSLPKTPLSENTKFPCEPALAGVPPTLIGFDPVPDMALLLGPTLSEEPVASSRRGRYAAEA